MRKIVLQETEEGSWTASFIGSSVFTIRHIRAGHRALDVMYRQWLHQRKVKNLKEKLEKEEVKSG